MVIQTNGTFNKRISLYAESDLKDFFIRIIKERKKIKYINLGNGKKEARVNNQNDRDRVSLKK